MILKRLAVATLSLHIVFGGSAPAHAQSEELRFEESRPEVDGSLRLPAPSGPRPDVLSEFRPFRIGYLYVNNFYEEPGVMNEKGSLHGLGVVYEKFSGNRRWLGRISGDLSFGQVNYTGGLYDRNTGEVTPHTTTANDSLFNAKASVGIPVNFGNRVQVLHFIGYGYRYLNDQLQGRGAYEREIPYSYLPLGLEFRIFLNRGYAITVAYEYDHFLSGQVTSHFTQLGASRDLVNTQTRGRGDRIMIDFVKALEDGREWHISPYYQRWDIARSDLLELDGEYGWHEPANKTVQYGVSVSLGL